MAAALECQVGGARVAFPTAEIAQLIEYEVAGPLPFARQWVAGVGIHLGRALLSVSLQPHDVAALPYQRRTRGIWLNSSSQESCGFAVEVLRSLGLVQVVSITPARIHPRMPTPAWLKEASTSDGRRIGWVSPSELVRDLGGGVARR
jgi:hypothetical protein